MTIFVTPVHLKLEYGCQFWNVDYVGDIKLLERIQRKWTRVIRGISDMLYDERMRHLELYSVRIRLLRADLSYVWKKFNGESPLTSDDQSVLLPSRNNRGHCFKICPSHMLT